jgi:hypothetical protein
MNEGKHIVVSSGKMNDKGFVTPFDALDFSVFLKNPVGYWDHDKSQPPIVRWTDLKYREDGAPMFRPVFSKTPRGQEFEQMFNEGTLNACSISGRAWFGSNKNVADSFLIDEISIVGLPSDKDAVVELSSTNSELKDGMYVRLKFDMNTEKDEQLVQEEKNLVPEKNEKENKEKEGVSLNSSAISKIADGVWNKVKDYFPVGEQKKSEPENNFQDVALSSEKTDANQPVENPEVEAKTEELEALNPEPVALKSESEDTQEKDVESSSLISESEYCASEEKENGSYMSSEAKLSSEDWNNVYNERVKKKTGKSEKLKSEIEQQQLKQQQTKNVIEKMKNNESTFDAKGYEKEVQLNHAQKKELEFVEDRESILHKVKKQGLSKIENTFRDGTQSQRLNLYSSLMQEKNASTILDVARVQLGSDYQNRFISVNEYLKDTERYGDHSKQMALKSGAYEDVKLHTGLSNVPLDVIGFLASGLTRMFSTNAWMEGIDVLPVRQVTNTVGVVIPNIHEMGDWENTSAQTDITDPLVGQSPRNLQDSEVEMKIYEYKTKTVAFKTLNNENVAYNRQGEQMSVIMNGSFDIVSNFMLYEIFNAAQNLDNILPAGQTTQIPTTGNTGTVVGRWRKVTNVTSHKYLSYNDTVAAAAIAMAGLDNGADRPKLLVDAFLWEGILKDADFKTVLTSTVDVDMANKTIRTMYYDIVARDFYARYNPTTSLPVSPYTAVTDPDEIQVGMAFRPSKAYMGVSAFDVYTLRDPQYQAEVFSLRMRYGAGLKTSEAMAPYNHPGAGIIVPTV